MEKHSKEARRRGSRHHRTKTLIRASGVCASVLWASATTSAALPVNGGGPADVPDSDRVVAEYLYKVWTQADGLPEEELRQVALSRDGYLWIATTNGLVRFDGVGFVRFQPPQDWKGAGDAIRELVESRDGNLWIRTEKGRLQRYSSDAFETVELGGGCRVNALDSDPSGDLWIGTECGLFRHDGTAPEAFGPLAGQPVTALIRDRRGTLLAGTRFSGLCLLEARGPRWLTSFDGFASDEVRNLAEDEAGGLRVTTSGGVDIYHEATLTHLVEGPGPWATAPAATAAGGWTLTPRGLFRNGRAIFSVSDPGQRFTSFVVDHDGTVWLTDDRRLHALEPVRLTVTHGQTARIENREVGPGHGPGPARIERILVDGEPIVERGGPLLVSDAHATVTFEYTAPELRRPHRLHFRHRLEGRDDNWVEAGPRRSASYSRLPPGRYVFHVNAGLDGTWHERESRRSFEVRTSSPGARWWLPVSLGGLLALAASLMRRPPEPAVKRGHTRLALKLRRVEVTSADDDFLDNVKRLIEEGLGDESFNVAKLADGLHVDRTHLFRRLRKLTGQTPSELLRTLRLRRAAQLLAAGGASVTDIAFAVGYKTVSHFSQSFREHFGIPPSEYTPRPVRGRQGYEVCSDSGSQ